MTNENAVRALLQSAADTMPGGPVSPPPGLLEPGPPAAPSRRWVPVAAAVAVVVALAVGVPTVLLRSGSPPGPSATASESSTIYLYPTSPDVPLFSPTINDVGVTITDRLVAAGFENVRFNAWGTGLEITVSGRHAREEFLALVGTPQFQVRKVLAWLSDQAPITEPPATGTPGPATLEQVRAKLGDAYDAAVAIDAAAVAQGTVRVGEDGALMARLAPFDDLRANEVAVLPYFIQFVVPQVSCAALAARAPQAIADPGARMVVCDDSGVKYLLDAADVVGADLADAQAGPNPYDPAARWQVELTVSAAGTPAWDALIQEAYGNQGVPWSAGPGDAGIPPTGADAAQGPRCVAVQPRIGGPGEVCMVAFTLDGEILTAPSIQAQRITSVQVAGDFTQDDAVLLASQLRFAALPYAFEIVASETIVAN